MISSALEAPTPQIDGETETGPPWAWGEPWPDGGACDGKVMDSVMVTNEMGMWGRMGHPCGTPFVTSAFLIDHPECAWEVPYLHDFGGVPWTYFKADM